MLTITSCSVNSVLMNATVQEKISSRNLKLGSDKCSKMHVGKGTNTCPEMKTNDVNMKEVKEITYLGSVISCDGKPDSDISMRHCKGISAANQILAMLNENFAYNYFQVAMTFRNSIMINSMMCSLEARNFLNMSHLNSLQDCDHYLMMKLFLPGAHCPTLSFYWETGVWPIQFILMGRRLMFHWSILQKNDDELVKQTYNIMSLCPISRDWINLIKNDLTQCGIPFSESLIKGHSKVSYKALVKQKINALVSQYLTERKSSKTANLTDIKFQDYLACHALTLRQKRLLFKFRVRMISSIKDNYKNQYKGNMLCPLDQTHYDDQQSLLKCPVILENKTLGPLVKQIEYTDIFKSVEFQIPAIQVLEKVIDYRTVKLDQLLNNT